jgi:uncharacterized protein YkwD
LFASNFLSKLARLALVVPFATMLFVSPADAATVHEQVRVIQLVNAERAAHGLGPLAWDQRLVNSAEAYAGYMAGANFFSHTGLDGSRMVGRNEAHGYLGWAFMGENLAAGQPTPERVVAAWMNSPTHRANVLADAACEIGIGHSYTDSSRYKHYWAMEIGC